MKTVRNTNMSRTFKHKKKVFRRIKGPEKRWEVLGSWGWFIACPGHIRMILEK